MSIRKLALGLAAAIGLSGAPVKAQDPIQANSPLGSAQAGVQARINTLCNTAPDASLSESLACNQSPTALLGLGTMSLGDTQVGVGTSKKYGIGANVSGVFLNDAGNSGAGVAVKGNKNHINATLVGGHALKYGNIIAGVSGARFDVERGLGVKDPIDSRGTAYRAFIGLSDMRASETLSFNVYALREHASNVRLSVEEKIVPIKWSDTSPDVKLSYSGNDLQVAQTNFFGNTSTGVFGDAILRMGEGSLMTRLGYKHTKNDFTGEKDYITYGFGYKHTTDQNRWNVMFNQNGDQKNITAEVGAKISKKLAWFARGYVSQSSITTDYGVMAGIDTATWRHGSEQGMMDLKGRISATMSDTGTGTISDAASMGTIGTQYYNTRLSNTLEKADVTVPNPVENLSVIQLSNGKYQIQFSASSNVTRPLYYMSINGKPERAITNGALIDAGELNFEGENRIDVVVVNAPGSALAAPAAVNSAPRTPYIARSEKRTCILVITSANKSPIANPDSATTTFGTPVSLNVLGNDIDPEKATLSIGTFTQPQNGTVTRSGSNLLYTPKSGFSGTDTFTYYAYDGRTNSIAPATVSVTVTPEIKQPPTPTDTPETITSGGASTITTTSITVPLPIITDRDNPTGFNVTPILVVKDASGTIVSSNSLIPNTPYTYYFTYMTYNGATNTLTQKSTPVVSFRTLALSNQAPVAFDTMAPISLTAGVAGSTVLPGTSDNDGDTLTYSLVGALPSGFSFDPATRTLSWTTSVIPGNHSNIVYKADDGKGGVATTTFSLVATSPVLSTPTAINLSGTATLTAGSLSVGQNVSTLSCAQAEGIPCTYTTSSSDFRISGTALQINNPNLPAGTYTVPVTATVTNVYGVMKVYTQNVSIEVKAPAIPTLPASLPDLTVGDNGGGAFISFDIQMPVDVPYQVSGLPTSDGWGQSVSWSVTQTGSMIHVRALSSFAQGDSIIGTKSTFPLSITSSGAQGATSMNFLVEAN